MGGQQGFQLSVIGLFATHDLERPDARVRVVRAAFNPIDCHRWMFHIQFFIDEGVFHGAVEPGVGWHYILVMTEVAFFTHVTGMTILIELGIGSPLSSSLPAVDQSHQILVGTPPRANSGT